MTLSMTLLPSRSLFKVLLIALALNTPMMANASDAKLLDRIIAIVNDDIILKSALDERIINAKEELRSRNITLNDDQAIAEKVLDTMVMEKLQLQRIKQRGIQITDNEVLAQIQNIAERNRLSIDELRNRLNISRPDGFVAFREQIRQQGLFAKLREVEVISKTQITEEEVDNYLQRQNLLQNNLEYSLAHIVVNLPESPTPAQRDAAQQKAEAILKRLQTGEDFSQVAVRESDGGRALQGGDLGWLNNNQIPTFFADSLNTMEEGQISNVIRSPVGFHIIKLNGQRNKDSELVTQYQLHRFILLSDEAKNSSTPGVALIELTNTIKSLQDFKNLKIQFADIPAAVNANSNLGWLTLQEMPPQYRDAVINLKPQQTAQPIASDQGWEILYLDKTRQADLALVNKRQKARQVLTQKKASDSYDIWLRRIKDEALIDLRLNNTDILKPARATNEGESTQ